MNTTKKLFTRLNYKLIFPQNKTNVILKVYSIDKKKDKIDVNLEIDRAHFTIEIDESDDIEMCKNYIKCKNKQVD